VPNDIYPRPARPSDISLIDEWIRTTPQNLFDESILQNANLKFYCADNGAPLLFMPAQSVWMLESLAVRVDATPLQIAKAIEVVIKTIIYKAEEEGVREIYFLCRDDTVKMYAANHKWTVMMTDTEQSITLFRWKVGQ
jgi:hypothetical protein